MIITDVRVHKVAKDDPRYPDAPSGRVITDVYRCETTLEDGSQQEAIYMLLEGGETLTPKLAETILKLFGAAVGRIDEAKAA